MKILLALAMAAAPVVAGGPVSEADFAEVAVPLVAKWEGKRNHAYLDTIASPPVWTVCYGETRGVRQGDFKTDAECLDMLKRGLNTYRAGLHRYFSEETLTHRLTPERDAAYVSLAWNVGIAGAGRSTATRRLNAGDIRGGCEALTWWSRAGGRVVRGLVRRRAEERALCLAGLS
jgi:GH24 family phage-related lysozyme (muramidase)